MRIAWTVFLLVITAPVVWAAEPPSLPQSERVFPLDVVRFSPYAHNPVFRPAGLGHWDVKIRERGWILREGDRWHLWYTGTTARGRG
jgi:hypothetical protein